MFDFKHKIELKTTESISLFGEDYYGDKSTFWNVHQTTLNNLYDKVIQIGFPIKITDLQFDKLSVIENLDEFHSWLKSNHPFDFNRNNDKLSNDEINHLTCGIFNSNSWNNPSAYRIYSDKIEEDDSGNYWSQRFTQKGYQFKGEIKKINADQLNEIRIIFNEVPLECFELKLPEPNRPGNKNEYGIYIQVELKNGKSIEFKIDEYDARDANLNTNILTFKEQIKDTIKLIERADNRLDGSAR